MIYLDYASTTPLLKEVKEAMIKAMDVYGNPSNGYTLSDGSRQILEDCRQVLSERLNGFDGRFIFTSGGSEANTTAIMGSSVDTIFYNPTEHDSTINAIQNFHYRNGMTIKKLIVNNEGIVDIGNLEAMLENASELGSILISVMMVNNETGAKNDIKTICEIVHQYDCAVHCDMVQALPHCQIDLDDLGVDYATFSAHKIGGPKGVGALWIRNGYDLRSTVFGGKQEFGLRGGTENIIGIAGFEAAIESLDVADLENKAIELRTTLFENLKNKNIEYISNSPIDPQKRTNAIINISIPRLHGDSTVIALDQFSKIFVSTASACSMSGKSYVLKEMGLSDDRIASALRISFGPNTTSDEVVKFVEELAKVYVVFGGGSNENG